MGRPRYPWIKLWFDCLSDPKLKRLSMAERCCWYELLLLAGSSPVRGKLMLTDTEPMTLEDIMRCLCVTRNDKITLSCVIPKLINMKVIYLNEGAYQVTNFVSRQDIYQSELTPNKLRINSELTPNKLLQIQSQIQKKDNKKENVATFSKEVSPELPDWLNKDIWHDFLEMRKRTKAPATDRAIILLINKLSELKSSGNDPDKVLEQSIMNSWKGLFPLKDKVVEVKTDEWNC